ncbi:MAG: AbrB/MazE/SpoVT family DNA-binding domain-containing protein [Chitinophagaceae bacterium]
MIHRTNIIQIGNSKGVRIPKEMLNTLGSKEVTVQKTEEGILIKPAQHVPPLNEWASLFAKAEKSVGTELEDWNESLGDGLEKEAPYE